MRILALILSLVMVFAFVACTDSGETSDDLSTAVSDVESKVESSDISDDASDDMSEDASDDASADVSDDVSEDASEDESQEPIVSIYEPMSIGKASTAPVVDGEVGDDEYETVIAFDNSKTHWNFSSTEGADAYNVKLHLSWDDEYLYSAVTVKVGMPRTYDNTNLAERPYIFDRRHVMTAIIAGNPIDPKYQPPTGEEWDWGTAYNSGLANEWTITAQPDGEKFCADHFGALTTNADFDYTVGVSKMDTDVYEQKIPWSALADIKNFTVEAGAVIGYAFTACCEEIDITVEEDPNAIYASFGGGITAYKNFADYVGFTLAE